MSGIYIHIPFCRQACTYCDFHFSTQVKHKDALLSAMHKEIRQKSHLLTGQRIETVYLGGGTPSLLTNAELRNLFGVLYASFDLSHVSEVTLEANPDDISLDKLSFMTNETPTTRLSVGIQSFHAEDLQKMNRAHNADQAHQCIEHIHKSGLKDFSIDLIFSLPWRADSDYLAANLQCIDAIHPPHISCYQMTIEPRTVLHHQVKKGVYMPANDERSEEEYSLIEQFLSRRGYEHYEVSNYSLGNNYALHNLNYWKYKDYLGLGPSAHSYINGLRYANISSNHEYIKRIHAGTQTWIKEELTQDEKWNELILISLRTQWGLELAHLTPEHMSILRDAKDIINYWSDRQLILLDEERLRLSQKGMLFADRIAQDLFVV